MITWKHEKKTQNFHKLNGVCATKPKPIFCIQFKFWVTLWGKLALFKKKNLPKPDNWQQKPGRNTSHEQFRGSFKCQTDKSSPRFHTFPLAVQPIQSPELACAAFRNASSSSFPFLTLIAATKWPCPFPHSAAPPLSLPSAPCRWKLIHDRRYVLKRT